MSILQRIIANWKMTVGGMSVGVLMMVLAMVMMNVAACHLSLMEWAIFLFLVFAGPTVVGALGTDNGQKVG